MTRTAMTARGRLAMRNMPTFALNSIILGQGAGVSPIATPKAKGGIYVGTDEVNKAIPHGLLYTPRFVFIVSESGEFFVQVFGTIIGEIFYSDALTPTRGFLPVTEMGATNFYVGNATSYQHSANSDPVSYAWLAIAQ